MAATRRSARMSTAKKSAASQAYSSLARDSVPILSFEDDVDENDISLENINSSLTVLQLQSQLKRKGLKTSGRKSELIARLRNSFLDLESEVSSLASSKVQSPRISVVDENDQEDQSLGESTLPPAQQIKLEEKVAVPLAKLEEKAAVPLAADPRTLKIQFNGNPVDSIRFDLSDPLALDNVSAILRNLFPGEVVNLDPKVDMEPVYLTDDMNEVHILTLGFLHLASLSPTDKHTAKVFQVKRGLLPVCLDEPKISQWVWELSLACTLLQLVLVWGILGISPVTAFNTLQKWTSSLFREVRSNQDWGIPASLFLCVVFVYSCLVVSSFLSPVYRFNIKAWYPRLIALRVDASRWAAQPSTAQGQFFARLERVMGFRTQLGIWFHWIWIAARGYFFKCLAVRLQSFLLEATVVYAVAGLVLHHNPFVWLLVCLLRPKRDYLRAALAWPGFQINLHELETCASPLDFECVASTSGSITLKWNGPANKLFVNTENSRFRVGVMRYEVSGAGQRKEVYLGGSTLRQLKRRNPSPKELVMLLVFGIQVVHAHVLLGAITLLPFVFALFFETHEEYDEAKGVAVCFEHLTSDHEFQFQLDVVDELGRKGTSSVVLFARTKPKVLLRRLLLASEDSENLVRCTGVVWNADMNAKETDVFLRTLRSAFLPNARRDKNEADFVFSDSAHALTHHVVSPPFVHNTLSTSLESNWRTDPIYVIHPPGTRHHAFRSGIESHLVVRSIFGVSMVFASVWSALHVTMYLKQAEESRFWNPVGLEVFHVLVYMWVCSNLVVGMLKRLVLKELPRVVQRMDQRLRQISRQNNWVLIGGALVGSVLALLVFGSQSFSGIGLAVVLLSGAERNVTWSRGSFRGLLGTTLLSFIALHLYI